MRVREYEYEYEYEYSIIHLEREGQGGAKDEAARIETDDGVDLLAGKTRGEEVDGVLEAGRVQQEGSHILEGDAFLWEEGGWVGWGSDGGEPEHGVRGGKEGGGERGDDGGAGVQPNRSQGLNRTPTYVGEIRNFPNGFLNELKSRVRHGIYSICSEK